MFTGIVEELGVLKKIEKDKKNVILFVNASFLSELQVNQSIAHNGVCLTVTNILENCYEVCIVNESILKTNFKSIQQGDRINLERCLKLGDRIDGHIVQGHVDGVIECCKIIEHDGSWIFRFEHHKKHGKYLATKGSVCINGVSLTIANIYPKNHQFDIAIIPYTFKNTNFNKMRVGDLANIECDILAKQLEQLNIKN